MKIRKHNGSEVDFCKKNIIEAISKANERVRLDERLSIADVKEIAKSIEEKCKQAAAAINSDDIHMFVRNALMASR